MDTRFHCVYLLTSLDPQCEGDFYIGYTVNPLRRLRQHNGELVNGARRTSRRGRPWTIVCCVSGFTDDRAALKFEWCWQHPTVSARLRNTIDVLTGLRRLPYAVATLHLLVRASLFCQLDLTLHIFEPALLQEATARAEVFLATRRGALAVGRGLRVESPRASPQQHSQRSASVPGQADDNATPPPPALDSQGGLQDAPLSSTLATTTATSRILPSLTPSLLFHVEATTRQAFEDAYLSHDRCLLLPGVGTSVDLRGAEKGGSPMSATAGSFCPYDVSLLCEAVRAEWSHASFASDSDDEGTRRLAPYCRTAASRTPSPQRVCTESMPDLLGYRSEGRAGDSDLEVYSGSSLGCGAASRSFSSPPSPLESSQLSTSCLPLPPDVNASASFVVDALHDSVPAAYLSTTAAAPTPQPRIPLRFAGHGEVDFARAHAEEQNCLHHGLLPCSLCALPLQPSVVAYCSRAPFCALRCHLSCLAMWMLYSEAEAATTVDGADTSPAPLSQAPPAPLSPLRRLIPSQPCPCPLCGVLLHWGPLVKALKKRVVVERRLYAAQRRIRMEQRWQARLNHINTAKRGTGAATRRGPRTRVSAAALLKGGEEAVRAASTTAVPTIHAGQALQNKRRVRSPSSLGEPPLAPLAAAASCPSPSISFAASSPTASASAILCHHGALTSATGTNTTVAAMVSDASLLSLTDFCEDDWL
ncbi:structure-specific endonuclease, putative [Leishmania panamensis]|uniref:Structure-specific endonuclease subunit SLX1 homolog n=1 Tax=Leishmania panamensis TaxID=5679 RepID=A0A088RUQ2_LEIPA|nr:structure-specific endonuclease, putative [Leishmania panamensis]AIN98999.1 structure-specific endonuclease, putative [Leishmania panamensis]